MTVGVRPRALDANPEIFSSEMLAVDIFLAADSA
jgi:hypothetical protein